MERKTLLTNIGNRNITYRGKTFNELIKTDLITETSFRDWTYNILKNFDDEKENIQALILPALIDHYTGEITDLILCFSDQDESIYNGQDTVYEAEILKKLLKLRHDNIKVHTYKLDGSVVDINSLMQNYRRLLNYYDYHLDNPFYYINNAGGTPQSKSSLRIMVEFLLKKTRYCFVYIDQKNKIEEFQQIEYREIIEQEQAIALIKNSRYLAAINLLSDGLEVARNSRQHHLKLLAYLYYRKNTHGEERHKQLNKLKKYIINQSPLLQYDKRDKLLGNNTALNTILGKAFYARLIERLYHVILYRELGEYTSMIKRLSIFYEELFNMMIEKMYGYCLFSDGYNERTRLINDCNIPGIFQIDWKHEPGIESKRIKTLSIPVLIAILRRADNTTIQDLMKIINRFFSVEGKLLNRLRNDVVHRGLFVDKKTIKQRLPSDFFHTLEKIIQEFKLSVPDIYKEFNQFLIKLIRT